MPTDCRSVSGVEQGQERVPTRDPLGDGSEHAALGAGCGAVDQALAGGGGGAVGTGTRRRTVADRREFRLAQALGRSDALPDASA